MERTETLPLGIVVERRESSNRWQPWVFRPVAVIPGAGPVAGWQEMMAGPGWTRFHVGTLTAELYRSQTPAYLHNLSMARPSVYVVLRRDPDAGEDTPFQPHLVTLSPYESEEYSISGDELVDAVPMPDSVMAWLQTYVDQHHVEQPFIKRQRDKHRNQQGESPVPLDVYGKPVRGPVKGGGNG